MKDTGRRGKMLPFVWVITAAEGTRTGQEVGVGVGNFITSKGGGDEVQKFSPKLVARLDGRSIY
eukprot:764002-Hanusia_phi.AAC.5